MHIHGAQRCFLDTLHAFKRLHTIKVLKSDHKVPDPILNAYLVGKEGQSPIAQQSPTPNRPSHSLPLTHHRGTTPRIFHTPSPIAADFDRATNYFSADGQDVALETASDRVPVEPDRVRDQEVEKEKEIETRDQLEVKTKVGTDIEARDQLEVETKLEVEVETKMETGGQLDVETKEVTDGQLEVETEW
ncbi:hypothetical protein Adt_33101 [Abeliophyllum distichum]|uniref:DUF2382 domain-containing protein n=1 Tax=Abeliophyllum distichum TaxID=126358 RepID=A0ABD1QVA7_9LAMI